MPPLLVSVLRSFSKLLTCFDIWLMVSNSWLEALNFFFRMPLGTWCSRFVLTEFFEPVSGGGLALSKLIWITATYVSCWTRFELSVTFFTSVPRCCSECLADLTSGLASVCAW